MLVSEQSCPASSRAVESLISELSDIPTPRTYSAIGDESVTLLIMSVIETWIEAVAPVSRLRIPSSV